MCLFIVVFFIATVGYYFATCHTSMMVNGVNGAKVNGEKMVEAFELGYFDFGEIIGKC